VEVIVFGADARKSYFEGVTVTAYSGRVEECNDDPDMTALMEPPVACAYIRQDIAQELALALVDLCEDAAIEDMMLCSGKTRKRCREIKEIAITYMED